MRHEDLSSNLEDYLEVIFFLENQSKSARAKDIADRMGVQRASVTGALQSLSQKGLINYEPYSSVTLTSEGFRLASRVVHRHKVLKEFLMSFLKLPEEVAESNACRLEHHIDDQTLERLIDFIQFVQTCPRTGLGWLEAMHRQCGSQGHCENCTPCLEKALNDYLEKKS